MIFCYFNSVEMEEVELLFFIVQIYELWQQNVKHWDF